MELRHADRLASKLIEAGAKAEWKFRSLESSNSFREVLVKHVTCETNAIQLPTEILDECDDVDFSIVIKGIREDEREHLQKVAGILKGLKTQ